MYIVLAVATENPYREAVESFAGNLAELMGGCVRLAALTGRPEQANGLTAETIPEDTGALVERMEDATAAELKNEEQGSGPPEEVEVVAGPPVEECVRELAACDLGVVGKTMEGELAYGRTLGPDVEKLKRRVTKPLVIVPETVRPIRKALFVYTDHPESSHALELARPLSAADVQVHLLTTIPPLGRSELMGTGAAYLRAHDIRFTAVDLDCAHCQAEGGPVTEVLHAARQEAVDLIVMGGTHRGLVGRLLWPEMAHDVAWNADLPVLIWY
jgi:nucleotide-binding universal stress UspA family protein